MSLRTACAYAGISDDTLWRRRKADAEFAARVERAREMFKAKMVTLISATAPKNWNAAAWLLERKHPEEFGRQRLETEHSGAVKITIEGGCPNSHDNAASASQRPSRSLERTGSVQGHSLRSALGQDGDGCDDHLRSRSSRESWGLFAPDYKITAETYREIYEILDPITVSASKIDGVIRLLGGGRVDFWTLNNPRAGRSRKYHGVMIDEAAFAGPDMQMIWERSIKPALLDHMGVGWALSSPAGKDDGNWFHNICTDPARVR